MKKSFRNFALAALAACAVLGTVNRSEAGIIPWAYNAVFGPVGSLRSNTGAFLAHRPSFGLNHRTYASNYGGYYGGYAGNYAGCYQPACNTGCGTGYGYGTYSAGYYPAQSYYSGYGYGYNNCCSSCGNSNCYGGYGCSSCNQGCASGNCGSTTTPATGITPGSGLLTPKPETQPTPAAANPTPTTTFKSTDPKVKPEAEAGTKNENYDENGTNPDGFKLPMKPGAEEKSNDAPPFKPFEALKVPAPEELTPVKQKQPAPSDIESESSSSVPSLKLVPAPVEIDNSEITSAITFHRTRVARTARFAMPQIARLAPSTPNNLIPPLPTPLHLLAINK